MLAVFFSAAAAEAQTNPAPKPAPKAAKKLQLAFFQLESHHVDPKTAEILSDEILVMLSKMPNTTVIGSKEIDAMMGYEQKRQMAGCSDTKCMVAIGGALGVDKILMGSVGKLGNSYILNLRLLDINEGKVDQLYSNRSKGGTEEDFLDVLPAGLAAIFPAYAGVWIKGAPIAAVPAVAAPAAAAQAKSEPQKQVEKKAEPSKETDKRITEKKAEIAKAEKKAEPAREKKPLSHAGKVILALKLDGVVTPSIGGAIEVHAGYGFNKWIEMTAGAVIANAKGAKIVLTGIPYNPEGVIKPIVSLHVPITFGNGGILVGTGVAPGFQWDFHRMFGLIVEIPIEYFFIAPAAYSKFVYMGTLGLQFRI